ncbi:diguanylate cyclase (GGDEF)-like protein [Idiomarina fontislapidosi]|uniref:diguanylate cyclase n=1 Tax=Idiomarina fontislapidosi TaxID=263723 RepID=A0A432Y9J5_9GAMM|nr:GGDEF domain-containing protein [Idiomarina fontislapidosi]PYE34461.1 diguanylate cyclase (GGDEF)-like protein [Idiomarina fontislapidosi]RUO57581.1 hypothetical protein CWE25_03705 [Idiomarina fontislapidosi]
MPLNKKYNISWLTGQFKESEQEARYRESIKLTVRRDTRLALIIVALIFAMFTITDYNLLGDTSGFYALAAMRISVVLACIALAVIIGRVGCLSSRPLLHAIPLWILATGIVVIIPLRPESLLTQITAVVVATMAFYLLIPNVLSIATCASVFLSVGFISAAVIFVDVPITTTMRLTLLLAMANIVGYCALLRLELLQRRQFSLLNDEREQNARLQQEVEHRRALEAQLRMLAEQDALTGLATRSHFIKRAEGLLRSARHDNSAFCILMIDIDHFKRINDSWGHMQGDIVLKQVASTLRCALREVDVIGRFGGEEFIVAMPNIECQQAISVATRLKSCVATIELAEPLDGISLSVTIGIAVKRDETMLDELIQQADEMLYKGKRSGRNRVEATQ